MKTTINISVFCIILFSPTVLPGQENVLTVRTPLVAVNDVSGLTGTNAQTLIQYFDVVGRPVQSVQKGFSPGGGDLANYVSYDRLGCKVAEYLPEPFSNNGGTFVPESSFLSQHAWKRTYRYESSVTQRVVASGGLHYGGKEVTCQYRLNTSSSVSELSVFQLSLVGDNVYCNVAPAGIYHVTETCDEDGHRLLVFTDHLGKEMVKRKINESEFYDTYFIYDVLDRPVCVLPPAAVVGFKSGGNYALTSGSIPYLYCYRYEYDYKNCKIGIKRPGADWIYIVYDGEDRPVLTQDGNQRKRSEWSFTKYDGLGRVILQGTVCNKRPREDIEDECAGVSIQEVFTGTGTSLGYTNKNIPSGNTCMTITAAYYYDTYDFTNLSWPRIYRPTGTSSVRGLLTGSYETVLGSPDKGRITVLSYDDKARVTNEYSYNSLTGKSISHNLTYNFSGLPVREEYGYNDSLYVTYTHTYDHALRRTSTDYSLRGPGGPSTPASGALCSNVYDAYGRLSENRSFHANARTMYSYYPDATLRTVFNSQHFKQELYKGNYGSCPYNLSKSYNGNISDMVLTQHGEQTIIHYDYDGLGRLLSGVKYSLYNLNTLTGESEYYTYDRMGNITELSRSNYRNYYYALSATYSGNQLAKVSSGGGIPFWVYDYAAYPDLVDLSQEYYYDANGNQTANLDKGIVTVRYNSLNLPDTVQFGNGNRIIHSYLSGGERIRTVSRTYTTALSVPRDAVTSSNDPHTDVTEARVGSLIYQNGAPDRLDCEGGYWDIRKNSGSSGLDFHPYSYICDYLGSVRLVYDGRSGEVVQSLEYLPSGLICKSENYDLQSNKYTGKELLSMHGLNQYDSHARMQEFQLPGFTTQDPLCEKYYDLTPYGYCEGNPVNRIDPDGREFTDAAWIEVKKLVTNINRRQADNSMFIMKIQNKINEGGLSEKKIQKLKNKISKLEDNSTELETARGEIATLAASNQVYDIYRDNSLSTDATAVAGSAFNSSNGNFDIILPSGGGLSLLAHELKHAFQFETGDFSSGKRKDGLPFYDQTDEVAGYKRGALFGGESRSASSIAIDPNYGSLQLGPMNMTKLPSVVLSNPLELQKLSNRTQSTFRINGVTYRPKTSK